MAVQRFAVGLQAFKPHDEEAARIAASYLVHAEAWRQRAVREGDGDPLESLVRFKPDIPRDPLDF